MAGTLAFDVGTPYTNDNRTGAAGLGITENGELICGSGL